MSAVNPNLKMAIKKTCYCVNANQLEKEIRSIVKTEREERLLSIVMQKIREAPPCEVAPVKHGKWIYDENGMDWNLPAWVCSECKAKNDMIPTLIRYGGKVVKVTNPNAWAGSNF